MLAAQFIRYFIGGLTALLVHLLCLTMLVEWLNIAPTIASGAGFIVASIVNYTLQHRWVFGVAGGHKVFFSRYIAVTLSTFALNILLFWIVHQLLGVAYLLTQILVTGSIFVLNFIINRSYTFRARQRSQ